MVFDMILFFRWNFNDKEGENLRMRNYAASGGLKCPTGQGYVYWVNVIYYEPLVDTDFALHIPCFIRLFTLAHIGDLDAILGTFRSKPVLISDHIRLYLVKYIIVKIYFS